MRGVNHLAGKETSAAGSGAFGATTIATTAKNGALTIQTDDIDAAKTSPFSRPVSTSISESASRLVAGKISTTSSPSNANKILRTWTASERSQYVASLGILTLPGEEAILRFLSGSISKAPLPPPWIMHRDESGRIFFANRATGVVSWSHPLEASLRELAGVCRMCLTSPELRASWISELLEAWQRDAKLALAKWQPAKDEGGREYFFHIETSETMWEHPVEVILPAHYLKIRSIEKLRDDRYIQELQTSSDIEVQSNMSFRSRQGDMTVSRQNSTILPIDQGPLGGSPAAAAIAAAIQDMDVTQFQGAPRSAGTPSQELEERRGAPRSAGTPSQELEERRGAPRSAGTPSQELQEKLKEVAVSKGSLHEEIASAEQEAERARADLARLQDEYSAATLTAESGQASLQTELAEEKARLGGLLETNAALEAGKQSLEAELRDALISQMNLKEELLATERKFQNAHAASQGFDTLVSTSEAQLAEERTNKERAQQAKAAVEARLGEMSNELKTSAASVAELQERLAKAEAELQQKSREAEAPLPQSPAARSEAVQRVQGAEDAQAALEAKLAEMQQDLRTLEDKEAAYVAGMASAENEVRTSKLMTEDFMAFAHQAQTELMEERRHAHQTLVAKNNLEIKLAELSRYLKESGDAGFSPNHHEKKEAALREEGDKRIADLEVALAAEEERQSKIVSANDDLNSVQARLEQQLQEVTASEKHLEDRLSKTEHELHAAKQVRGGPGSIVSAMDTILETDDDRQLTNLQAALAAEQRRRAFLVCTKEDLDGNKRELEERLHKTEDSQQALRAELSGVHTDLVTAQAITGYLNERTLAPDALTASAKEDLLAKSKRANAHVQQAQYAKGVLDAKLEAMESDINDKRIALEITNLQIACKAEQERASRAEARIATVERDLRKREVVFTELERGFMEREAILKTEAALERKLNTMERQFNPGESMTGSLATEGKRDAEDAFELTFSELTLGSVDQAAFRGGLLQEFRRLGASEAGLSKCRVALRDGSVTVEVRGPRSVVAELKALPLELIKVMGCKATIAPPGGRGTRSPTASGVPEKGDHARVLPDKALQNKALWRPQSLPDVRLQRAEHAEPRRKNSDVSISTMTVSATTGRLAKDWEQIAIKLFSRLEQHGGGFVAAAQVLALWPQLSLHVEFGHAEALVAHLQGSSSRMPISNAEWMSLLEALSSIVGPRRLRRNIRSADMMFGEIKDGGLYQEPLAWQYSSKSKLATITYSKMGLTS